MQQIIELFTDYTIPEKLDGGQNLSFKSGKLVFKPESDTQKYLWMAKQLENINFENIKVPVPVRSRRGNFIEKGYGAASYISCSFLEGNMNMKLEAAKSFHKSTKQITIPKEYIEWCNPWTMANRMTWNEIGIPKEFHGESLLIIEKLKSKISNVNLKKYFIHGDLAGNILFDGNTVVIIDISPEFRPYEYALSLLIADSIAWHNEPIESIELLDMDKDLIKQMMLRVILFRSSVCLFMNPQNISSFYNEFKAYSKILDYLEVDL